MGRLKKNISYIETIPIIRDFLEEDSLLDKKKIRRKLLDLAVLYPYITERYKTFDDFLQDDRNRKARFFVDFIERETADRLKHSFDKQSTNVRNRVIQIIWNVQGFLGYLSSERDLRANPKYIENMTPNPSLINKINVLDVYDLYEILPDKGRRRLKLQFYGGWNNVELVNTRLDDFKRTQFDEFFYIFRKRKKTLKHNVMFLNLYDEQFIFEYERFCSRYDIKSNELMFDVYPEAVSAMYNFYSKNPHIRENVKPKYLRQLCFTRLEDVFKQDADLFDLWTQHKMGVLKQHYIKNYVERFVGKIEEIKNAVLIGNMKYLTVEVQTLKKDIQTEILLQRQEIENIKKKQEDERKEIIQNAAKDILKAVLDMKRSPDRYFDEK